MQGLVNFTTAIADGIAVALPTFCYLSACGCFMYFAWTLWKWSEPHARYHHNRIERPWAPFISLALSGVFASFTTFLTMANVSTGTNLLVGLTAYAPSTAPNASSVLGATPDASVINVVTLVPVFFSGFRCRLRFLGDLALARDHQWPVERLAYRLRCPVPLWCSLHQCRDGRDRH